MGLDGQNPLLLVPDVSVSGPALGKVLLALSACAPAKLILAGQQTERLDSAVYGPMPLNKGVQVWNYCSCGTDEAASGPGW